MHHLEELVACSPHDTLQTAEVQDCHQEHGHYPKDDIQLGHEFAIDTWLGLVEARFDDGPAKSVQERLDEDDAAGPDMEE